MNIAALVSGGVDSSVMIHLLKELDINPTVFYIQIGMKNSNKLIDCSAEEDIEITTWIANKYGLKLEIVNLENEYWETVIEYTINSVKNGLTPNPDIMCNRMIKFGCFNDKFGDNFQQIATGHYANTAYVNNIKFLSTAVDTHKDQTDFLSQITYNQLLKADFPIGKYNKSQIREIAQKANLPSAFRKDSQGICFLGKINYTDFLKKYVGEKKGDIIELETGKVLGKHNGYWFHTIGQRKGLGLGEGPWFVIKKDCPQNIIYVSNGYNPKSQYTDTIVVDNFNFISINPWDSNYSSDITFKIRHSAEFNKGSIELNKDKIIIKSKTPVSGVAAGQFAVIYDKNSILCYGSGEICN